MPRSCLSALALLVAASLVRADDAAAQELYKKALGAFLTAETVHVKEAKTSGADENGEEFDMTFEIWLAGENRLSLGMKGKTGSEVHEGLAIIDGRTFATFEGGRETLRKDVAPDASTRFRDGFLAGGLTCAIYTVPDVEDFTDGGTSDFKPVAEGKVAERIASVLEYTYRFTARGEEVALGVKLYVDKETLGILKRETTDLKRGLLVTEEYTGVELDAAPPDGTFTLPAPAEGTSSSSKGVRRALRDLVSTEAAWRQTDPDRNGEKDYWTLDVAGGYYVQDATGSMLKGIDVEMAQADRDGLATYSKDPPRPMNGYWLRVMKTDERGQPYIDARQPAPTASPVAGRPSTNTSKFGFCAYPAEYGVTGKLTYIVNEEGVVYEKDLGPDAKEGCHAWPGEDPKASGWTGSE